MVKRINSPYQANSIPKPDVISWILVVFCAVSLAAAGAYWFDQSIAKAIFYAAVMWAIPQLYFSWQSFKFRGARQMDRIVKAFRQGSAGKIVLTATIAAIVFKRGGEFSVWVMFVTYMLCIVLGMIGFNFKINHPRKR